jgi:hypothetical protein
MRDLENFRDSCGILSNPKLAVGAGYLSTFDRANLGHNEVLNQHQIASRLVALGENKKTLIGRDA